MTTHSLDHRLEAYLTRHDDALMDRQFFELLAEIERRRAHETMEVTVRLINGQVEFQPANGIHAHGNELWVDDKRVVVKMVE